MANSFGHITVELLARMGESEPQSLGFVHIPLTVRAVSTGTIEGNLSEAIAAAKLTLERVFGKDES